MRNRCFHLGSTKIFSQRRMICRKIFILTLKMKCRWKLNPKPIFVHDMAAMGRVFYRVHEKPRCQLMWVDKPVLFYFYCVIVFSCRIWHPFRYKMITNGVSSSLWSLTMKILKENDCFMWTKSFIGRKMRFESHHKVHSSRWLRRICWNAKKSSFRWFENISIELCFCHLFRFPRASIVCTKFDKYEFDITEFDWNVDSQTRTKCK